MPVKTIKINANISQHDLNIKIKKIQKFKEKKYKIHFQMILKGRIKTKKEIYQEKFFNTLKELNSLGLKNSEVKITNSFFSTNLF